MEEKLKNLFCENLNNNRYVVIYVVNIFIQNEIKLIIKIIKIIY
jgi:hypothetical protein